MSTYFAGIAMVTKAKHPGNQDMTLAEHAQHGVIFDALVGVVLRRDPMQTEAHFQRFDMRRIVS